jgi:NDP-4-keto-2,6-dideoxyhexose 3-C-methyltransferase
MREQPDPVMTLVQPQPVRHDRCRNCGMGLVPILSLGPITTADFPRSAGTRTHPPVPLDLMRCPSIACGFVQLAHTTPPDWLFRQYWYRSGVNETMRAELADVVEGAMARVTLLPGDTVADIGANDGTLLQQYPESLHLTTVAWEPATNLYEALRPHARVLFPEYFHAGARWEESGRAKVATAVAMFYDLDDPHDFLEGITRILHPEGVLVIQQAYLPRMIETTGFDNCCLEHLGYHDLRSMEALLGPHGLQVVDVEERAINGGSFRTVIALKGARHPTPAVEAMRRQELEFYADGRAAVWARFATRVEATKRQLRAVLDGYQHTGGAVDLYAASTKSNTLLQVCGIDARQIRQAWDRSPEKWERYLGGTAIPIVSEEHGRADPPAALLVGAWGFREAFLVREQEYLEAGGRMIFPLPRVETVMAKR